MRLLFMLRNPEKLCEHRRIKSKEQINDISKLFLLISTKQFSHDFRSVGFVVRWEFVQFSFVVIVQSDNLALNHRNFG